MQFFFFNDTATTEIYTLSLHDALPIFGGGRQPEAELDQHILARPVAAVHAAHLGDADVGLVDEQEVIVRKDRKSTRLNSSHANISYAVFCLKKKNINLQ